MSNDKRPNHYLAPNPDNLPPNSILNNFRVADTAKPQPHLMRLFTGYVDKNVINPTDLPEISVEEFGRKWLALFNYGAHENHSEIPIMDWVEQVAGSPYREVRLMHYVNGVYSEVARIPPIFDRLTPFFKEDTRDYFVGMATMQAHLHGNASRTEEANGFIKRNLTDRIDYRNQLTRNFHRMTEIFKLYGVEREIPDWIKELDGFDNVETTDKPKTETKSEPGSSFSDGMIEEDE